MPADPMTLEELRIAVADGTIDTVVLAMTDIQGRLQGKRLDAEFFLNEVVAHGTEGCNYLLAVDVDMNTVDGYAISSWERGYGDLAMMPDFATLRRVPWHPGTALLLADVAWLDGADVVESPRQILKRQLDRLAEHGWNAYVGTELEFIVFEDSFESAWDAALRRADAGQSLQHRLLDPRHRPRSSRCCGRSGSGMRDAGMQVESAKGECNPGQQEIAFRYADCA